MMGTLLGHLAQWGTFSSQGEVLCTQGLAHLLNEHAEARSLLAAKIETWTGTKVPDGLRWYAEAHQPDNRKPDLEARLDGDAVVKIEAKLDAFFGDGQLQSYVNAFERARPAVLLVLVPRYRTAEAATTVGQLSDACLPGCEGAGPDVNVVAKVISWHELLETLGTCESPRFRSELEQFDGMYRTLSGDYVEPLLPVDDRERWSEQVDLTKIIDDVTRLLTLGSRPLPFREETLEQPDEESEGRAVYRFRYVCLPLGSSMPCFSIGVRPPFASANTPFWLRFHRDTPEFPVILDRLERSDLREKLGRTGGHIWIPLLVHGERGQTEIISTLLSQAGEVINLAYGEGSEGRSSGC